MVSWTVDLSLSCKLAETTSLYIMPYEALYMICSCFFSSVIFLLCWSNRAAFHLLFMHFSLSPRRYVNVAHKRRNLGTRHRRDVCLLRQTMSERDQRVPILYFSINCFIFSAFYLDTYVVHLLYIFGRVNQPVITLIPVNDH